MPSKKEPKPIGEVTHYYGGIGVAIVKFSTKVSVGDVISFKGKVTDFEQEISSIQYEHREIREAKKGKQVGIKVGEKVREGDKIYAA